MVLSQHDEAIKEINSCLKMIKPDLPESLKQRCIEVLQDDFGDMEDFADDQYSNYNDKVHLPSRSKSFIENVKKNPNYETESLKGLYEEDWDYNSDEYSQEGLKIQSKYFLGYIVLRDGFETNEGVIESLKDWLKEI